jgi:hypothetical protein
VRVLIDVKIMTKQILMTTWENVTGMGTIKISVRKGAVDRVDAADKGL